MAQGNNARYSTLISPHDLSDHYRSPDWTVIDCRFSLADTAQGARDYFTGHVPGAFYAHLDRDLSSPVVPGTTGRHPLPRVEELARRLGDWGVTPASQVVVYDDAAGAIAGRLWWLLRWLGHDAAALLDGGWQDWISAGFAVQTGAPDPPRKPPYPVRIRESMVIGREGVKRVLEQAIAPVIDARAPERFRGEVEPIDPVAGCIKGAVNRPFDSNLEPSGRFRPSAELRGEIEQLLGSLPSSEAVCYCGSGVTAAHNVLAFAHAGLPVPKLYAGSWSEWITDPEAPREP